jgi:hypothetical protein
MQHLYVVHIHLKEVIIIYKNNDKFYIYNPQTRLKNKQFLPFNESHLKGGFK